MLLHSTHLHAEVLCLYHYDCPKRSECLQQALTPLGAIVMIEAQHLCMQMRGVEKQGSTTTTIYYTGVFENNEKRKEFLSMVKG